MPLMLKSVGRALGYVILRTMAAIIPLLPLWAVHMVGRRLGDLGRVLSARRRRIADRNLRIAFGDALTPSERRTIAEESFRQFGMLALESMKFPAMTHDQIAEIIEVDTDSEAALGRLRAEGAGIIFVSAHFGNFELAARSLAIRGIEVAVVVKPARDARTTDLMTKLRNRNGMTVVRKDRSIRPMLATLKRGGCVAILADQNGEDVFVPFFGQPTGTVDGPARLSIATGAPIVVGYCQRTAGRRYWVSHMAVVRPDRNAETQSEVVRIMTETNRALEAVIRRSPAQWLWCHNRWRSSPAVEPRV